MVELKIEIWEELGQFHAKTTVDIYPENDIEGKGQTPYEALDNWLTELEEHEYFRPD